MGYDTSDDRELHSGGINQALLSYCMQHTGKLIVVKLAYIRFSQADKSISTRQSTVDSMLTTLLLSA